MFLSKYLYLLMQNSYSKNLIANELILGHWGLEDEVMKSEPLCMGLVPLKMRSRKMTSLLSFER